MIARRAPKPTLVERQFEREWLAAVDGAGPLFCTRFRGKQIGEERQCSTAANLIEHVLPPAVALRQWVLTFPFSWRRRLAQDGAFLGALGRIFVDVEAHRG